MAHQAGANPGFCSMKGLGVFVLPQQEPITRRYPFIHLGGKRGTMRVKCRTQEQNTMSPARARTRTARSGVKRTDHGATTNSSSETVKSVCCGRRNPLVYISVLMSSIPIKKILHDVPAMNLLLLRDISTCYCWLSVSRHSK